MHQKYLEPAGDLKGSPRKSPRGRRFTPRTADWIGKWMGGVGKGPDGEEKQKEVESPDTILQIIEPVQLYSICTVMQLINLTYTGAVRIGL